MAGINFGNRLKELRGAKDVSQDALAEALNVSRRSISAWENGVKLPSYDSIVALCLFFRVSADYMLGLKSD